jgi:hypothetical protein
MAGILFTDGKFVLAGYKGKITGIGGKKQLNETPIETATREMVEELFELEEIPTGLLSAIIDRLEFDDLISWENYCTFIMDFTDLGLILGILSLFNVKSRVYKEIPVNINELIRTRLILPSAELTYILLIPCEYNIEFDRHFLSDIYTFKNCERSIR